MGLDMYLNVEFEAPAYERTDDSCNEAESFKDTVDALGLPSSFKAETEFRWYTVRLPYAYWRKDNAVHKYIVDNFANGKDECQEIELTTEGVKEFVEVLKKVIATEGKEKDLTCRKLLPTASGCFFGSTDYDDWYFNGLKYTLERFESLLKYTKEVSDPAKWDSPKKIKRVIYEASW